MNNEKAYYDTVWSHTKVAAHSEKLVKALEGMIPEDVWSIVDVGCGNGSVTNPLAKDYGVIGVDYSLEALKGLSKDVTPLCVNAIDIPLPDKVVDLVLSSELLEHLDDDAFPKVISEMERLAKKYIIVSVPNNENLAERITKCAHCGHEFHIYLHKRSFSVKTIGNYFKGWGIRKVKYCGVPDSYSYRWLSSLKIRMSHSYFYLSSMDVVCPKCGKINVPRKESLGRRIVGRFLYFFGKVVTIGMPSRLDWMVVLFEREG